MSEKSWFSGAIIWKFQEGKLYFLSQKSWPLKGRKRIERKFVGGGNTGQTDLDPVVTLFREIQEETFLRMIPGFKPEVVHEKSDSGHRKIFFLVPFEVLFGNMRAYPIYDGDTHIEPPEWLPAPDCVDELHHTHWRAGRKAEFLLSDSKQISLPLVG